MQKVLHETEMQPQVSGKPLLILGNKQDCLGALNEDQIYKQLELDELTEKHSCPCQVFCCTAVLGKGNKVDRQIKKGFRWLLSEVSSNFTGISRRVEKEMAEQKREQDEEKERRRERVRLAREAREKAEREAAEKENQDDEESDDGVLVSKDKKKKKERPSPEAQGSKKKKKERETPEPDSPEKKKKKKKKKKKQKTEQNENDDAGDVDVIHRSLSPDETLESRTDDLKQLSPRSENRAVSDDTEVKKKKKKKKRKVNKTAPAEGEVGEVGEDAYELPPLAWGTPPGTMNGFPGSGSGTPRRLEPLGPTRRAGSSPFGSPSIPEGDEPEMSLPPLRVTSWPNTRPNSEDCDLVT